jgi:hypothetical protein
MWRCRHCEKENQDSAKSCGNCGTARSGTDGGLGLGIGLYVLSVMATLALARAGGTAVFFLCFIATLIYSLASQRPKIIGGFILSGIFSFFILFVLLWVICSGSHF